MSNPSLLPAPIINFSYSTATISATTASAATASALTALSVTSSDAATASASTASSLRQEHHQMQQQHLQKQHVRLLDNLIIFRRFTKKCENLQDLGQAGPLQYWSKKDASK